MRKKGFTLAEILITLGIVGVVAALTTPTLVTNSRNQANASKLASTVSDLENGFSSIIAYDAATDIFETELWENTSSKAAFSSSLTEYLHCTNLEISDIYSEKLKQLNRTAVDIPNTGFAYLLKSGATVIINDFNATDPGDKDAVEANGGALHSPAATLIVDVNGSDQPNTYGRDIFFYKLGNNGHLYPFGSVDVSLAVNGNKTNVWDGAASIYTCIGNTSNGKGCASRLMQENYKMNY